MTSPGFGRGLSVLRRSRGPFRRRTPGPRPDAPDPATSAGVEPVDETFLEVLSHEIRTPVTALYMGTRLLADPGLSVGSRLAVTAELVVEMERLYRVVEDVLVLGRLDHGVFEPERVPVAIGRVTLEAIADESLLAGDQRISYTGPRDLAAEAADPSLVRHVIRNLLDNAVQASGPRDLIEVVVAAADDEVTVRVLDAADLTEPDLTQAFELRDGPRATHARRAGGGLGLLVITRVVAAMDGRVWARRRDPRGTEFGFALPRSIV